MAVGGLIYAQPAGDDDSDVALPMGDEANLSPKEMSERTRTLIADMRATLARVLRLQQAARKQKDIIKLNCVNDKLLQVKQLLNIAEASRNNMVESISNRDKDATYHQFSQVTISAENTRTLGEEAEACIGEEIKFVGPTEVQVDKPPIVDDPTEDNPFDFAGGVSIERPGYASPFI